jgi:hypothetical protein
MNASQPPAERCPNTGDLFAELLPPPGTPAPPVALQTKPAQPARKRPQRAAPPPGAEPADIRLHELREIGLAKVWLDVANIVGVDRFFEMWKFLSSQEHLLNDSGQVELSLRRFTSYQKYQRNRYLDTLVQAGLTPAQLAQVIRRELGESLTVRQLRRLFDKAKLRGQ